ncbi:MAG: EscU/YscU/HrcU family type III secretion system export apparatus switch protein [Spirochaetes bacterium]|nr:EscU/YscU/HrcU family type III secretion system export apparatus switch protein [Spirochaetota bacterium]
MDDDKIGVALEYSGEIPRILAVARGTLFKKLIQLAVEHNITIYQDSDLAQVLSQLPAGSEIPEALFKAVSEVLVYCYRVNDTFKAKLDSMGIL